MVSVFHSSKSILKYRRSKIRIFYVLLSAAVCISKALFLIFVIKQKYMSISYEIIIAIDITSKAIDITLLDDKNINVKSYFKRRVQFDFNSWGVWLVTCIASYVHALLLPSGLDDAFDIACSSLERKVEIPVNSSVLT